MREDVLVNDAMGSADFLRQGGVEFLRDAWLAGEFGRHRHSSFARLVDEREQWPDFETRAGDAIERVECVEADVPGRRRGDEYREPEQRRADGGIIVENGATCVSLKKPSAHLLWVGTKDLRNTLLSFPHIRYCLGNSSVWQLFLALVLQAG
jgi:hypothetical protein